MKNIDTETVVETIFDMFGKVRLSPKILHDLRTQFLSEAFREVSHLLSIKQLTSMPYYPIIYKLFERFNCTMKQMLKKLSAGESQERDQCINALLFA